MAVLLFILAAFFIHKARPLVAEREREEQSAGVSRMLQQEENILTQYITALQAALAPTPHGATPPRFAQQLPAEINTGQKFNQWLKARFPASYVQPFLAWQTLWKARARLPQLMDWIKEEAAKMMGIRKELAEKYGDLSVVIGDPEKRTAFRKKNAQLAQELIEKGVKEKEFLAVFIPLEGEEIATQRWELTKAEHMKRVVEKRLEDAGCIPLMTEIKEQTKFLSKGPAAKMLLQKMGFYRDAFQFIYHQNTRVALEGEKGVEHLWKHLTERVEEVKRVTNGSALYSCLLEQKQAYHKARKELKDWLNQIRTGEMAAPEKSSLKYLMNPKETLNLEESFSHLEKEETTRILHILKKQGEVAERVPDLDQTLEELSSDVEEASARFEALYAEAMEKWEKPTLDVGGSL